MTEQPIESDLIPSSKTLDFPIVGIGASAGGLAVFEAFFSAMPEADTGMAFILVQHLAPDHKSLLVEIVRRYTRMQVYEVENGMAVKPNCAYIIPPAHDMAFSNGALQLLEPSAPRGQRMPIDFFFRSLALDQHERAIAIVLSGSGGDGTMGIRAIKGEGGMVMAQSPASAEYDSMPRSAIATGLVDYELPPAEMPADLIAYVAHAFGKLPRMSSPVLTAQNNSLKKIYLLLQAQTGHDFTQYKLGTVQRRLERRMAVHQVENIDAYVQFLNKNAMEIEALFRDLLIGVTHFFRDGDAFKALEEQIIPKLFASKPAGGMIRVWVPGCSTGEEAYSIAMLLYEHAETLKQGYRIQIFATDIDSRAITIARAGVYPSSVGADITPERLVRFFSAAPQDSAYRISKNIRDLVIFSEQDLVRDPPFSKLDLISCRNLMIYMGSELQRKIIPLFHYALNANGYLFLGTSEGIGEFNELFNPLERKAKLYQSKVSSYAPIHSATSRFLRPVKMVDIPVAQSGPSAVFRAKLPLRDLTERALIQYLNPTAVLVTGQGEILYLHGRTGLYLEPAPGEVSASNILDMAREGLRNDLSLAMRKADGTKETVRHAGVRVRTNGDFTVINLIIKPIIAASSGAPLLLVIFEKTEEPPVTASAASADKSATAAMAPAPGASEAAAQIAGLKQELRVKEEHLQSINEELETSNEELKSSNEELQSINEELQSANEELETSKEELQSVNEELATVNTELQTKVADLSRANNDLNNLLAGTGIATVFVDHQLHIVRFTPAATQIINLIQSDVGRPVSHIVSNLLNYQALVADTQEVLNTLIPKELEVQTKVGSWYALRIMPYRTLENVIEGAVITFVNISDMKLAQEALHQAEERARTASRD